MLKTSDMQVSELARLVEQFEACTLPKSAWTHEAHFAMALWYCVHQPVPVAVRSIREGIKKYNLSVGGVNSDEAGYHETITLFYTRIIIRYILDSDQPGNLNYLLEGLWTQAFLERDYLLQYYDRDVLMSKRARKNWVPPSKLFSGWPATAPLP